MRIIVVANQKGGVGKTTTTQNLGAGLAILGKKVLLVDCDHQRNLSTGCGVPLNHVPSLMDVLAGSCSIDEALVPFPIGKMKKGGECVLLPSSEQLAAMPAFFAQEVGKEFLLKELLAKLEPGRFDVVLLDSPPSFDLITVNAYVAATDVLVPVQAEAYSLDGVDKVFMSISRVSKRFNPSINTLGLVLTMFDKRKRLGNEVFNNLKERFPTKVFDTLIRDAVSIAEAPSHKLSIFDYDPKGYGAADYLALSREVLKKL